MYAKVVSREACSSALVRNAIRSPLKSWSLNLPCSRSLEQRASELLKAGSLMYKDFIFIFYYFIKRMQPKVIATSFIFLLLH